MTIMQVVRRWNELRKLLNDEDSVPILLALRKKRMRFSQIQRQFELNAVKLEKILKFLRNGWWVIPTTVPTKGKRILVEYRLSKRGEKLLELLD